MFLTTPVVIAPSHSIILFSMRTNVLGSEDVSSSMQQIVNRPNISLSS